MKLRPVAQQFLHHSYKVAYVSATLTWTIFIIPKNSWLQPTDFLGIFFLNKMSKHAKEHNSMSGKIWICNFDLEESKIWDANLPIPDGWIKGRHSKQNFIKIKQKLSKLQEEYELNCTLLNIDKQRKAIDLQYDDLALKNNQNKQLIKDLEKQQQIYEKQIKHRQFKQQQLDKLKLLYEMYKEFIVNEFDGVVKKFDYKYTRNNLIMAFKAHIPEYVPQKCNRWKNRNKTT